VLAVRGLSLQDLVRDVELTVGAGEVVGLAGLAGSGRTELLEGIFGLRKAVRGTITLDGVPLRPGSVSRTISSGVAYVPGDRKNLGLLANMSVAENLMIARTSGSFRLGIVPRRRERLQATKAVRDFGIVAPSPGAACATLSGGTTTPAATTSAARTQTGPPGAWSDNSKRSDTKSRSNPRSSPPDRDFATDVGKRPCAARPAQPMGRQLAAQLRRGGRADEQVHVGRKEIVDQPGKRDLAAAHRSPRLAGLLQHKRAPSRPRQQCRAHERVVAGADQDRVMLGPLAHGR
jgi:ABC-type transport system involved in cytochrome c biogenesis ATPase subunit